MVHDVNSIGFVGFLFSQLWSGWLADRFGRLFAMIILNRDMYSLTFVAVYTNAWLRPHDCISRLGDIGLVAACLFLVAFNAYSINIYIIGRFFMTFFDGLTQGHSSSKSNLQGIVTGKKFFVEKLIVEKKSGENILRPRQFDFFCYRQINFSTMRIFDKNFDIIVLLIP